MAPAQSFMGGSARVIKLEERVNQTVAHYLTTLTVADLRKYNPSSALHHCKTDEDFEKALNKLKVFLASIVGKPCVERTYRHSRGKDFGRMFCPKGIQSVWRAFRGALCKGLMTDVDMKNAHPVILLWLCGTYGIDCPKLRGYVEHREHHLLELCRALDNGSDREHCKRLFLMATNTDEELTGVPYAFFNEYQAEMRTIQERMMNLEELARFKPFAKKAAEEKVASGRNANEAGSFVNLVLCFNEDLLLQEALSYLKGKGIETAVLMLDGLMIYGDHYANTELLNELHTLLKAKHGIDMYWSFKSHETPVLTDMPKDFDLASVLDTEWTGLMKNIDGDFLRDPTDMARIVSGCHGQGCLDGMPLTWEHATKTMWLAGGREDVRFAAAWEQAESLNHDGNTLRHYSRASNGPRHQMICKSALELLGRTADFKEHELRDYLLRTFGNDVLCFEKRSKFCIWHHGRWQETEGAIMSDMLMDLTQQLFSGTLSYYTKALSKLVSDGKGDSDDAKDKRLKIVQIARVANQYGHQKNKNVL